MENTALIKNDAVVFAILMLVIYGVFKASKLNHKSSKIFFSIIPPILMCYFIPGVLNSLNLISGASSAIYPFVSKYLLPTCLLFFTLSLDLDMIKQLGMKSLLVFLAGSFGVIIGGPIALYIVGNMHPELIKNTPDLWRGLGTIAGSWIGGGANQTALKEILQPNATLFSQVIAVDVVIAEIWLAVLLWGVTKSKYLDKRLKADQNLIQDIQEKTLAKQIKVSEKNTFHDYLELFAVGFMCTGLAYFFADLIVPFIKTNYPGLEKISLTSTFFWVVSLVTAFGIILSKTRYRKLEEKGASVFATLLLYVLIAAIGMQMNIGEALSNVWLFAVGAIWISIHVICTVVAGIILRVPYFVIAVGSQANVGGAASASVVAGAFHPSLVPVGVLFAVLGYALGTYGGYLTAILMQYVQSNLFTF
jgi:uncharacterized membrane protein